MASGSFIDAAEATMKKRVAVVSRGWMGDSIACSAAAASLAEKGYETTFYLRWPQLKPLFDNDKRFVTRLYSRYLSARVRRPLFPGRYSFVVREPDGWSYKEPFTSEIRRMAGCDPVPEYQLFLSPEQIALARSASAAAKPVVAVARDSFKRAYGRDVHDLISKLSSLAEIRWVGLDPEQDSKNGRTRSLIHDASVIYNADVFVGPESGLLWLAAGLGTQCVYFSEHIVEFSKRIDYGRPDLVLGSRYHFPDRSHIELPAYCTNDYVVKTIANVFESRNPS